MVFPCNLRKPEIMHGDALEVIESLSEFGSVVTNPLHPPAGSVSLQKDERVC